MAESSQTYTVTPAELVRFRESIARDPALALTGTLETGSLAVQTPLGTIELAYRYTEPILTVAIARWMNRRQRNCAACSFRCRVRTCLRQGCSNGLFGH